MKKNLLLYILLLYNLGVKAQVTLPQVQPYEINKKNAIVGPYTPRGLFASTFPNFLKDGKYYFDARYQHFSESNDGLSFSDHTYPADMAMSKKTLSSFRNITVYLRVNNDDKVLLWVDHHSILVVDRYFDILHKKEYSLTDKHEEWYNEQNTLFKTGVQGVLNAKGVAAMQVMDLGNSDLRNKVSPNTDLIFDLRIDDSQTWNDGWKYPIGEYFPTYILYTLVIRNKFGEPLARYGQAVFVDAQKHISTMDRQWDKVYNPLFRQTFPLAFESLVNRFLEDADAVSNIKSQNDAWDTKQKSNSALSILTTQKIKYGELQQYKPELQYLCRSVKINYNNMVGAVEYDKTHTMGYTSSSMNTAAENSMGQAATALAQNVILSAMDRHDQKVADAKFALVKAEVEEFNRQIAVTIAAVQASPLTPEKDELLTRMAKDDNQFAEMINEGLAAQKKAGAATASVSAANAGLAQNFSASMRDFANSIQPVSAAIGNGGSSADMKVCADEATKLWEGSNEYRQTKNSPQQADLDDAKAKLLEIMIDHCSQYMSPQEIANYKRIAQETTQEAQSLRNGNTFKYHK